MFILISILQDTFVMYMYILIILVHNTLAFVIYQPESTSPNVGTVLFTKSDLVKKRWSKEKIKLLLARKYLQHLIPTPHLIDTMNEEFLNNLLSYYEECYRTIKREIKNPEVNSIMNTALSDALGGYLKVWVLPVTKYAYYGGAISMDKAINTFQVFEDIKRNLRTDGSSWRNANENLLKSVAIDVISRPRTAPTRSMKDPCKHLAYYEKTDTDLTVPLPMINWNILPITIFVPLKNQSLVPISSPNSSKILINYYDIAENCMQAQSPTSSDDFKQKFQTWLSKDVAPHLNDDNLYIAFGSILSLMNDTRKCCGSFSKACNDKYQKLKARTLSLGSPLHESSKKYLIILIIVLVEVIWCIPSLFYIIRERRRKRSRCIRSYFCKIFKRNPKNDNFKFPFYRQSKKNKINCLIDNLHVDKQERAVKLSFKPRVKTLEVDLQYPSCDSKYMSIKSSKSHERSKFSNQTSLSYQPLKKPSLKKIFPEFGFVEMNHSNNTCTDTNIQNLDKVTKNSKTKRQNLEPTPTLTVIHNERTIQEINYSQESILMNSQTKPSKVQCQCYSNTAKSPVKKQCLCTKCFDKEDTITENKNKTTLPKQNLKLKSAFEKFRPKDKKPCKTAMQTKVDEKAQMNKKIFGKNKIKTDNDKASKAKNSKPLLRIRIEKPQTEIKVGITTVREHSKNKPSRIPRLAVKRETKEENNIKNNVIPSSQNNERLKVDKTILRKKNLKVETLDDTAIKLTSTIDKKLNKTL